MRMSETFNTKSSKCSVVSQNLPLRFVSGILGKTWEFVSPFKRKNAKRGQNIVEFNKKSNRTHKTKVTNTKRKSQENLEMLSFCT